MSAAADRYDWQAEKDFYGFHPAGYVDDVANTLLDCGLRITTQ